MELTVYPLREENVGSGLAAVDLAAMSRLDLLSGEFVRVTSQDETVLPRAWPGYPDDEGDGLVRLDETHREALDVDVGDTVDVSPTTVQDANAVLVGVEEPFASLTSFEHALEKDLEGSVLAAGTTVSTTYEGAPERDAIPVGIAATRPEGVVRITEETSLEVRAYEHAGSNGSRGDGTSGGSDGGTDSAGGGGTDSAGSGGTDSTASGGSGTAGESASGATDAGGSSSSGDDASRTDATESAGSTGDTVAHDASANGTTYSDVGGLDDSLERVRELVELPFERPDLFDGLGIDPPAGVLLHGPPGTGKTLLARAVANEIDASFLSLPAPEVMSRYYGESEEYLRDVFEDAEEQAPAVVFIDEVDAITPERSAAAGDVERRVVAQLLTLMDGLDETSEVVVIGATNRPDAIDPALRRAGRFDREIEVSVPDRDGRMEILSVHSRDVPLADDVDLAAIADRTHGFVGADLAGVVQEAAMNALERTRGTDGPTTGPQSAPTVTNADFDAALGEADPSALRDMRVEVPTVTWDDIGGLDSVKRLLRESVEWPLKYPNVLDHAGLDPANGVLLYGPPGTGKTLLGKAVATESECNLLSIQGPELLSKWVGESESRVRDVFERARENAPAIVLFDEIDAIAGERGGTSGSGVDERVVGQLLTELDGVQSTEDVLVVATTNRPELIDDALLRAGRLERQCHVPVPEEAARREIFDVQTDDLPLGPRVTLDQLAAEANGYVGADIEAVCRTASAQATRRYLQSHEEGDGDQTSDVESLVVTVGDFDAAFDAVDPSVTPATRERYEEYHERRRQEPVEATSGPGFQ